jgi:hypothetical protein
MIITIGYCRAIKGPAVFLYIIFACNVIPSLSEFTYTSIFAAGILSIKTEATFLTNE